MFLVHFCELFKNIIFKTFFLKTISGHLSIQKFTAYYFSTTSFLGLTFLRSAILYRVSNSHLTFSSVESTRWVQGDCSLDLNDLRAKITLTICKGAVRQGLSKFLLFSKRTLVIADWSLNKSACLLLSCNNVVSNNNFANFVSKNPPFHSDATISHNAMLTKVHFFDDRSVVWKKNKVIDSTFVSFASDVYVKCVVWDNMFELLFQKSYIFTWCCLFWKLIDTKGQIFNDLSKFINRYLSFRTNLPHIMSFSSDFF